jgi:hypothetical protein
MVDRTQPMTATDPAKLWEQYLAEADHPSAQGAMAFAADFYSARCGALSDHARLASANLKNCLAANASLKARIAELEANEKAYEEIIGKKTYREVADRIREMEGALQKISDLVESEAGEPLDDAIKIANDALLPKATAP